MRYVIAIGRANNKLNRTIEYLIPVIQTQIDIGNIAGVYYIRKAILRQKIRANKKASAQMLI